MVEELIALIIDESKWLTASMGLAFATITVLLYRFHFSNQSLRTRILANMNLYFAVMIGMMAFGHLLAVTTKLISGTLVGPVFLFYVIGAILAVPSFLLIHYTWNGFVSGKGYGRKMIILNSWLGITLLGLGIHNMPLAIPALFNIGYYLHSRRIVGWIIVSLAIAFSLVLFIGSLIFFVSGQSFEQFEGIQ